MSEAPDNPSQTEAEPMRYEGLTSAGVGASLLEYLHACPVCHCTELRHYTRVPSLFNDGEFICYERCGDCGVVLRNPRLPAAYREAKYEDTPIPAEHKKHKPKNQRHYAYMMRVIDRLFPEGRQGGSRRLFDFGCGSGGFLVEAQKAGWDVMGLELARDLARHVEEVYDIPVFQGLVSDEAFAEERFDIILSSQVFEHLLDPRQTLAELKQHLRRPGLILIELPNQRAIRERLSRGATMDDSHLFYFSAAALSRMLTDQGFRVVDVQEGLRFYRFFEELPGSAALGAMSVASRALSAMQVKTGLSVLARLEP